MRGNASIESASDDRLPELEPCAGMSKATAR